MPVRINRGDTHFGGAEAVVAQPSFLIAILQLMEGENDHRPVGDLVVIGINMNAACPEVDSFH